MSRALLLIELPGSGKSTIAKNVLCRMDKPAFFKDGLVLGHSDDDMTVFGDYRDTSHKFPGMDRTSMGIAPQFKEFIQKYKPTFFIEGDRLGNLSTIDFLLAQGYDLKVVHVRASVEELGRRYEKRGSAQSLSFLKSRETKIKNILEHDHLYSRIVHRDNQDFNDSQYIARAAFFYLRMGRFV